MSNKDFITKIAPIVVDNCQEYGYRYASPIIAQACLESGYGKSLLSSKYHNYFGLKCGSLWHGKSVNMFTQEQYDSNELVTIRDNFRVYDTMFDGVQGYFIFIQYQRYHNLFGATSPVDYLTKIHNDGYATAKNYVSVLKNIMDLYDLTAYDMELLSVEQTLQTLTEKVLSGKFGNNPERKERLGNLYNAVQWRVNEKLHLHK